MSIPYKRVTVKFNSGQSSYCLKKQNEDIYIIVIHCASQVVDNGKHILSPPEVAKFLENGITQRLNLARLGAVSRTVVGWLWTQYQKTDG